MRPRLAFLSLITVGLYSAKAPPPKIDILRFGESDLKTQYDYKTGALTPSGALVALLKIRETGSNGPERIQIVEIDRLGRATYRADVPTLDSSDPTPMAVLPNGRVVIVNSRVGIRFLLLEHGQALLDIPIHTLPENSVITKVHAMKDGAVLAVGRAGGQGALVVLEQSGSVRSTGIVMDPEIRVILDAIQTKNGLIAFLAGGTGSDKHVRFYLGTARPDGHVISKRLLKDANGSHAKFLPSRDGQNLAFSYDAVVNRELSLRYLSSLDAKETVVPNPFPSTPQSFYTAPAHDGLIVLGGAIPLDSQLTLAVWMLDGAGKLRWSYVPPRETTSTILMNSFDLFSSEGEVVIPFIQGQMNGPRIHRILEILRFKLE